MYKIELDPETGGIILRDKKAILNHEVRPVYAGELLELGAQNYWHFDEESDAPFMFADLGRFYYRGQEAFRTLKGDDGKPRIIERKLPNGRTLEPIDVPAMREKNATLLTRLYENTAQWLRGVYEDRKERNEFWYVAYSGGKDSQVLLDVALYALPPKETGLEVIFGDTSMEFPQTYEAAHETRVMCAKAGEKFHVASAPYEASETWRLFGNPGRKNRWCCDVHKSAPMTVLARKLADGRRVVNIQGVRKSESFTRSKYEAVVPSKVNGATDVRPLLEWNSGEIWLTIYARGLHVNGLYKLGAHRVGCVMCPMGSRLSDWIGKKYGHETYQALRKIIDESFGKSCVLICQPEAWRNRTDGNLNPTIQKEIDETATETETIVRCKSFNADAWKVVAKDTVRPYLTERPELGTPEFPVAFQIQNDHTKDNLNDRRQFIKIIRRGVYCVGCGVCEANCTNGAIACRDGSIQIDTDKCRRCGKCMTGRAAQCLRYKSRRVSKNRDEIIAIADRNMDARVKERDEKRRRKQQFSLLPMLPEDARQD